MAKTIRSKIIDGRMVAESLRNAIRDEVSLFSDKPGLAVILVGDHPSSQIYVKHKIRACAEVGFESRLIHLDNTATKDDLLRKIEQLNQDNAIHGILVQLPLPDLFDKREVISAIDPRKDVDGFHPFNVGSLVTGFPTFIPCTPYGVMALLARYSISVAGQHCVVVGASNIVGKPMSTLLLQNGGTVTTCNSLTKDLASITRRAFLVVSATGKPGLITPDHLADDAVVIDVGIHRLPNGKIVGDVDFERCFDKASYLTPVPGGVGPMTIAMLLKNTMISFKNFKDKK